MLNEHFSLVLLIGLISSSLFRTLVHRRGVIHIFDIGRLKKFLAEYATSQHQDTGGWLLP